MELSVIIVNYNVRQFLENALHSIRRAMADIDGEIFVVDNASTDGSAAMVRTKFPDVQLLENTANVGFARANNQALKRAQGRFLLLINPDTIVQESTFHEMMKFLRARPDVGLAGCKVLNPDGTFQLPCRRSFPTPWVAFTKVFGLSALFPRLAAFGKYNLTYLSPDETYPVDAVSGSFMMITRAAYEKVGGLDESFFMYGEDLDWCYRVKQAGFGVYYVHSTSIIHFKGESTRRSGIDEIRTFYTAMELFVEKHFGRSPLLTSFLRAGIFLREGAATIARAGMPLLRALVDAALVNLALFLSAWMYLGDARRFPLNADPIVWVVPALILVFTAYFSGLYTVRPYSPGRAAGAVIVSYVLISAVVFFAKAFAYSRAVVAISAVLVLVLLPGWRLIAKRLFRGRHHEPGRQTLLGSRAVIVGTGVSAQELIRKMRARVDGGYEIVGLIAKETELIGERIAGVEVIGNLENAGKVMAGLKVSDVIFSTDGITYGDILSVIGRTRAGSVSFRLVPGSLEAIVGKTRIDALDTIPLVEIDYSLHRPGNRLVKRLFDVVVSLVLLPIVYLPVWLGSLAGWVDRSRPGPRAILSIPAVLTGRISFVGRPLSELTDADSGPAPPDDSAGLGPCGLTGLAQVHGRPGLPSDEIERYKLYYAKNQSLIFDIEIIFNALFRKT
jgi:GT2 family glycosyltransferase/lipopolysaccharide/colanic/teichoic acid biosynthesis glycosyltransferase